MSNINSVSSLSDIEQPLEESPGRSMVPAQQSSQPLLQLVNDIQDKFKTLPVPYDFNRAVSVSRLLSHRFKLSYSEENYQKSCREISMVMLGTVIFIFASIITWGMSKEVNFLKEGDFIYNTGLIGGILMLLTLLYSAAKRISFVNLSMSSVNSYYFHVICGAVGALFIVVHSSFDFRSINSSVAVVSMLVIMMAGAFGRYLYTYFSLALHRLYLDVKIMEPILFNNISAYNCNAAIRVRDRLSKIAFHNLNQSKNGFVGLARGLTFAHYALYIYILSLRDIYSIIRSATVLGDLDTQNVRNIKKAHRRELWEYIYKITKMGYINSLEQIFKHWRILHVPFLFILVLTSVAHVVVVHMY